MEKKRVAVSALQSAAIEFDRRWPITCEVGDGVGEGERGGHPFPGPGHVLPEQQLAELLLHQLHVCTQRNHLTPHQDRQHHRLHQEPSAGRDDLDLPEGPALCSARRDLGAALSLSSTGAVLDPWLRDICSSSGGWPRSSSCTMLCDRRIELRRSSCAPALIKRSASFASHHSRRSVMYPTSIPMT